MSRIKSALEIALERSDSVKSDKGSVEQFELKREGKRIGNAFLEAPADKGLEAALKTFPKDKQEFVKRGAFDVLVSQLSLPGTKEDLPRLDAVAKGIQTLTGDKKLAQLLQQLLQALEKYLADADQYDKAIRRQFEPKLKQKEEELARRTGRRMQIDPFQDPEFVAFYNQNMGALKEHYQVLIEQVRTQAATAMGVEK